MLINALTIRNKDAFLCLVYYLDSFLSEPSASPAKDNYRMNRYKNKALNPEEMRRRREEEGIQLRKQKREQQVFHLSPPVTSPHPEPGRLGFAVALTVL